MRTLAERVRRGDPIPLPLAAILTAATPLVRAGMCYRLSRPRVRVDAHVISFGNITAGGTGKTPAVIERARAEVSAGRRVAVLTRGYGARKSTGAIARSGGLNAMNMCEEVGDEPALIARKVPEVLIVKCADRVLGARKAIDEFGCDTLILDDGFQHVRLERDENILVIDSTNPLGNGKLLPRGILREPLKAMARATHVILTRCGHGENLTPLLDMVATHCPDVPVRKTRHAPASLWRVRDGAVEPLETLRNKQVFAICGIGNPDAFFDTLEELGADIMTRAAYPDHCEFPAGSMPATGMVITTEKDAMRISDAGENVYALGIELEDVD